MGSVVLWFGGSCKTRDDRLRTGVIRLIDMNYNNNYNNNNNNNYDIVLNHINCKK